MRRVFSPVLAAALVVAGLSVPAAFGHGDDGHGHGPPPKKSPKLLFFVSDGMRQDAVQKFADDGDLPGFAKLLDHGTRASGHGLLTQAPPNTGAGWYTLFTGAWPGVHGSTNNTFHVNGQPFTNSTSSFGANVLQAESLAQAAERAGKKVAQIEYSGGREAPIDGPTLDFRNFRSGRGVATNYTNPGDNPGPFGVQYDQETAAPATGWTHVPTSHSPAKEMRLRVLDGTPAVDKYGLNAYIYDSRNDHKTRYDRVLFSRTKDGGDSVGDLAQGEWADVKVKIVGAPNFPTDPLNGKTGGFLVKVEALAPDLSKVRLFHTSVTRAIATWNNWPGEPGFTGSFEDYVAEKFPSAQSADFAVLESGIVSEDTYVQQGLYWEKAYHPIIKYVLAKYQPDVALVGYSETDEFQHQFLGLVTKKLPNGAKNPAYDDVQVNGTPDGRVEQREGYIRTAYERSDATMRLAQQEMHDSGLTTFVASDHGFAPQFAAVDASKPLVDLGLLSTPQTANCRPAATETIGSAKACWAGGTAQIYLNVKDRDPAGNGFKQIPQDQVDATVARIRAAYQALQDPNDWTGDAKPEHWTVIDRTFTKAESRHIPNGPHSTADMAHPTRTGDAVVFSYPPYEFDAATPGTLVARSAFFGQHGYVPDVQNLKSNTNMRATFLAGGPRIEEGKAKDIRSIDVAPTMAFLLGIPAPQNSQGVVRRDFIRDSGDYTPISIVGLNDFHGQLDQTTGTIDNLTENLGGAPQLATMFDEEAAALPGPTLLLAAGDNVGASPPNSALLEDLPTIDVENAWGLDATSFGNHEFDYGVPRILEQEARSRFPWLSANIVDTSTGKAPDWIQPSTVLKVHGIKVGVIGATVHTTPELVSAGNTAGLTFLDEAPRIAAESARLKSQGVNVQVVVIHEGATLGANATGNTVVAAPWQGPIIGIVQALQNTTIDLVIAGHTHRAANTIVGHIPVVEGVNAGASYSVAQLMVKDGDVAWTGTASRAAKNLGVSGRSDVQAIVDKANADTAPLRNQVVGTQSVDIKRDPTRLSESAMGNLVADAMLAKYPEAVAAVTNSGGLRQDILISPPTASEQPGQITWGEVFAVLPFGNRAAIETLTGAQLQAGLLNGVSPACDPNIATGRFPQVAGLKIAYHCSGTTAVIDSITHNGTAVTPTSSIRIVTNDFMLTGGDGYTAFQNGTDVRQPDSLLELTIEYITAHSPVAPVVEGRVVKG